jgi:hypothetical protein
VALGSVQSSYCINPKWCSVHDAGVIRLVQTKLVCTTPIKHPLLYITMQIGNVSVIPSGGRGDSQNALKFPYNAEYAFMLLCKYIIRTIILDNDLVRTIKIGIQGNVRGQHAPLCPWITHKIVLCVLNHRICNSLPTYGFWNHEVPFHAGNAKMV